MAGNLLKAPRARGDGGAFALAWPALEIHCKAGRTLHKGEKKLHKGEKKLMEGRDIDLLDTATVHLIRLSENYLSFLTWDILWSSRAEKLSLLESEARYQHRIVLCR